MGQYLKKGSSVYVEGRLQTRKYTDKDGVERYATEIIAESMQMLGTPNGAQHHAGDDEATPAQAPAAPAAAAAAPPTKRGSRGAKPAAPVLGPADDSDVPF